VIGSLQFNMTDTQNPACAPTQDGADSVIAGGDAEIPNTAPIAAQFTGAKPDIHQGNLRDLHPAIVKRLVPLPNWVCWKFELNEKRTGWTKIPYQPQDPTRKGCDQR
jgi:hypothetical protein